MTDEKKSKMDQIIPHSSDGLQAGAPMPLTGKVQGMELGPGISAEEQFEVLKTASFLSQFGEELEGAADIFSPNPFLRMALHLVTNHIQGRTTTPNSLLAASGVPYATAVRRLQDMIAAGLIEKRPRTKTGKSFSLHPSQKLLRDWMQLSDRINRIGHNTFGQEPKGKDEKDYYFGSSYLDAQSIPPLEVLAEPIRVPGGVRVLVHSDPTFMVMDNLKRQFEQVIGTEIHQRAFSIDRLHEELIRNAERKASRYDIVAVDLPWVGEFAERGMLLPLGEILDVARLDPPDFHTAGWKAAHWGGKPYGVPAQTTPELLFYRKDMFAKAGLEPPRTTSDVLTAAKYFHNPAQGRYGIAWNAARGTALGHTFLMTMADFGKPVIDLPLAAGGFDTTGLASKDYRVTIDNDTGLQAAEYLKELLQYSPPYILSMSWYERIRPYAAGEIPMAYGYTLLAPYFERDPMSPASGKTGYLPHPSGPDAYPIAPVGGYMMAVPANIAPKRREAAAEALIVFTSAQAQKLYIQNGSRTNPRYSVSADSEVRRLSPIFEAIDGMSWRDELQFWPRPPIPEISEIIRICGEELHDMLRGVSTPREAISQAQQRAEGLMRPKSF